VAPSTALRAAVTNRVALRYVRIVATPELTEAAD